MPIWSPDVSHPLLITSAADEELEVPPRYAAASERTFRRIDILRGLRVELPHGNKTFGEEKEQGRENGLVLSGKFSPLEDVIVVIPGEKGHYAALSSESEGHSREVSLAPPGNSI